MRLKINENNMVEKDYIFEMANMLGKKVKVPHKLPFSFYFSASNENVHGIRVKPVFNPEKFVRSQTGTLKLCDNWEYIPGKDDNNVSQSDIDDMKQFFRDYLVLFCMVWDEQLSEDPVQDYFKAEITLNDLIQEINFYDKYANDLDKITTIEELEKYCKDNNLVNFYGN